jgi:hypothetical protein
MLGLEDHNVLAFDGLAAQGCVMVEWKRMAECEGRGWR